MEEVQVLNCQGLTVECGSTVLMIFISISQRIIKNNVVSRMIYSLKCRLLMYDIFISYYICQERGCSLVLASKIETGLK